MDEIKIGSSYGQFVKQEHKIKLPMESLASWGDYLELLSDRVTMSSYDDWGNDVEGEERIMPCDIGFDTPLGEQVVGLTTEIMDIKLEVEVLAAMPNESLKALNAHYITGLNLVQSHLPPSPRVLVLCAGNGEDLPRLVRSGVTHFDQLDVVGCTPFRKKNKLATIAVSGRVRYTSSFVEDLPMEWFSPSYNLILCHHGLHHVMRTHAGSERIRELCSRLTPDGIMIADKIDLVGLDTLVQWSSSPTHSVELLTVDKSHGIEGRMSIRVGAKVWDDPILTDHRLYDNFPGMNVHVLQGRGAFSSGSNSYGQRFIPPSGVLLASKRGEVRIMTYVEVRPRFMQQYIPVEPTVISLWQGKAMLPSHVVDQLNFPINHGMHFQMEDIPFLGDTTMFSEKSNGVAAKVLIGEGAAYMCVNFNPPQYYVAQGAMRVGLPMMRLQCEWVDGRVILLDPIHLGVDTPSGFYARRDYYNRLLVQSPWVGALVHDKVWSFRLPMPEASAWEGVVMMNTSCPSPFVGGKYCHTARYAKWVTTVDVASDPTPANPDGIIEVDVYSGRKVRDRPDKKVPNSKKNIADVHRSIDLPGVIALIDVQYDHVVEANDLLQMRVDRVIHESHGIAIALRFPNRKNPNPSAQIAKEMLLETIGCGDVVRHHLERVNDHMDDRSWLIDVGMLGSGNSKGDGPGFDALVRVAEEERYCAMGRTSVNVVQRLEDGGNALLSGMLEFDPDKRYVVLSSSVYGYFERALYFILSSGETLKKYDTAALELVVNGVRRVVVVCKIVGTDYHWVWIGTNDCKYGFVVKWLLS